MGFTHQSKWKTPFFSFILELGGVVLLTWDYPVDQFWEQRQVGLTQQLQRPGIFQLLSSHKDKWVGCGVQPFRKSPELRRGKAKMFHWSQENLVVDIFCFLVFSSPTPFSSRSSCGSWDRAGDDQEKLLRPSEPSQGDTRSWGWHSAPTGSWAGRKQFGQGRAGIRIQTGQQSSWERKILHG